MTNDIFSRIRQDHDKHRTLISLVEKTHGDSSGRRELFPKLAADVRAHAHAEEIVFYAELMANAESRDKSGHSVKEHHEMEAMLADLESMDYSSTGWLTRFRTFADKLRHHMDEEKTEVFSLAGRVLSDKRKTEMVAEFDHAKSIEKKKVQVSERREVAQSASL